MSIALDIEGRWLASLRRNGETLIARRTPASYLAVPNSESERRLLERARIPYAACDGSTIVVGRHALDLAPLIHVPLFPILPASRLPENDPLARQLAATLIESLLPAAPSRGELCTVALPTGCERAAGSAEWEFFSRLLRLRGYRTQLVTRAAAVTLAELSPHAFSGLVLMLDACGSSLTLMHHGAPQLSATLARGGDWIDEQFARKTGRLVCDVRGVNYVDMESVARWKSGSRPNIIAPHNDEGHLLSYLYQEVLKNLVQMFLQQAAGKLNANALRRPLALACCGEATEIAGFGGLVTEVLRDLSVALADVRQTADARYTVARGCLIQAELQALPQATAA